MFCSLRAKCYTLLLNERDKDGNEKLVTENKLKGVNKEAVGLLDLSNYLRTLFLNETQFATSNRICSKGHNIFIQKHNKNAGTRTNDDLPNSAILPRSNQTLSSGTSGLPVKASSSS